MSVAALGVFLLVFGSWGLTRHLGFLDSHGAVVMGLSTNGLLATISVVVSLILIASAIRGGPTASATGIVAGGAFLVSGLVNTLLLGSEMNMLAFRLPNVIFSVAVGALLLFVGAYGRLSGGLPVDSPYYRSTERGGPVGEDPRTNAERLRDAETDLELAEAERAVAQRAATPLQREGVRRAAAHRSANERRRAWRAVTETSATPPAE